MKNNPYVRVRLIKAIEGLLYVIGLVIYPFAYLFRKSIVKHPSVWKWLILYWFTNKDEPTYIDNWYGVYELLAGDMVKFNRMNALQKFVLSYKWAALRNPHWNLKKILGVGTVGEIKGLKVKVFINLHTEVHQPHIWRNKEFHGEQHIEFNKGKYKHFRKSITRPLKNWSPLKWFGYTHINKMLGCGEDRYISKLRYFKYVPKN